MPLFVHPTSTCDVCLEAYSFADLLHSPHAIACGHVFCLECMRLLHAVCPLCRRAFNPERIKKLHIDRYDPADDPLMSARYEENDRLERIATFFGENASHIEADTVAEEIEQWLCGHPDLSTYRALRAAVTVLRRYILLQQQHIELQKRLEDEEISHQRTRARMEQDRNTARATEANLFDQLTHTENELKEKLAHVEAQLANSDAARRRAESMYQPNYSNPLPPPPRTTAFENAYRPRTAMSAKSAPGNYGGGWTFADYSRVEPPLTVGVPATAEDEEDEEESNKLDGVQRPPLIVRGAPVQARVVPSLRTPRAVQNHLRTSDAYSFPADPVPNFGYTPAGYVPTDAPFGIVPSSETRNSIRSSVSARLKRDPPGNALGIVAIQQYTPLVPPAVAAVDALQHPDDTRQSSRSSSGDGSGVNHPASIHRTRGVTDAPSRTSSGGLNDLALLGPPPASVHSTRAANMATPRTIADVLDTPQQASLSPASTWGTISTGQPSSRNSSLGSLGLLGLPGGFREMQYDAAQGQTIVDADVATPRSQTSQGSSTDSADSALEPLDFTLGPSPPGVFVPPSSVSGTLDLGSLHRSLTQLVGQEEHDPERNHHVTPQPDPSISRGGTRSGQSLSRSQSHSRSDASESLSDLELSLPSMRDEIAVLRNRNESLRRASRSQTGQEDHSAEPRQTSDTGRQRHASTSAPSVASTASGDSAHREPPLSSLGHTFEVVGSRRDAASVNTTRSERRRPRQGSARSSVASIPYSSISAPGISQSSLLISFPPSFPTTSAAVTHRGGDPSQIHAPYPVRSRESSLLAWPSSRSTR